MTKSRWIVNSSPMIVFSKIGRLDLLQDSAVDLIIPEPVAQELLQGPPNDKARKALEKGWGKESPLL